MSTGLGAVPHSDELQNDTWNSPKAYLRVENQACRQPRLWPGLKQYRACMQTQPKAGQSNELDRPKLKCRFKERKGDFRAYASTVHTSPIVGS
jgi:hypothetical protein